MASVIADTVAGSSLNHSRAHPAVIAATSVSGSRAKAPASCVFSSYNCQKPVFRYSVMGPARHGPPSWVHTQTPSIRGFSATRVCSAYWYSGPRSFGNAPKFSNSRLLWNSMMRRWSPCARVSLRGSQL